MQTQLSWTTGNTFQPKSGFQGLLVIYRIDHELPSGVLWTFREGWDQGLELRIRACRIRRIEKITQAARLFLHNETFFQDNLPLHYLQAMKPPIIMQSWRRRMCFVQKNCFGVTRKLTAAGTSWHDKPCKLQEQRKLADLQPRAIQAEDQKNKKMGDQNHSHRGKLQYKTRLLVKSSLYTVDFIVGMYAYLGYLRPVPGRVPVGFDRFRHPLCGGARAAFEEWTHQTAWQWGRPGA